MTSKMIKFFKDLAQSRVKGEKDTEPSSVVWQFLGGNNKNRIGANCGLASFFDADAKDGVDQKQTHLLFDMGSMPGDGNIPEDKVLSDCDTVIPDTTSCFYHREDSNHIPENPVSAIFLTHSHIDHIGAIPYMILMGYKLPKIYATPFTAKRLYQSLENQRISKDLWPEVTEIAPGQTVTEGKMKVTSFSVSHSTPQSVGFYIETPEGNILQPGDFKLDQTLKWGPGFNVDQFKNIVKNGVDLLLLDSTGADKNTKPVTEKHVRKTLSEMFNKYSSKRFVIASMGGFEETLASVAQVTADNERQLWVAGWSHEQALKALQETGLSLADYIGRPVEVKKVAAGKTARDLAEQKPKDTVVLVTGAQGKSTAVLTHAANDRSRLLKLDKSKDIILFCAPSIPGPDKASRERLIGSLRKQGFKVFTNQDMVLYAHGHGRLPEILEMAKLSEAKTVVPVHGSAKLRDDNAKALVKSGFEIMDAVNGQKVTLSKKKPVLSHEKENTPRLIGFKTRTGRHWQDRDYMAIFSPQSDDIAHQEELKAKSKKMPSVFSIHPRKTVKKPTSNKPK